MTKEIDEEKIRDRAIRRLQTATNLAYKMIGDKRIDAKTRQGWFKRYTDANRALIQALRAREEKDWEKRLEEIREYRRKAAVNIESELVPVRAPEQSKGEAA